MASYLVGQITVLDEKLWKEYVEGVSISLAPFNASIVFRGNKEAVLAGDNETERVVVIKFVDSDELKSWFNSHEYQSIIELRDRAANVTITTYEEY
jgi:uncharacterized protein (DUF1330 family)